jgi:hypothetical protein
MRRRSIAEMNERIQSARKSQEIEEYLLKIKTYNVV